MLDGVLCIVDQVEWNGKKCCVRIHIVHHRDGYKRIWWENFTIVCIEDDREAAV